ncbi:MAG: GNAT family N-acetyltransferase [bacterium]|nr:GNAT family N-acetyltransferase [bacterium]
MSVPFYSKALNVRRMREEDVDIARRLATRAFGCNCLGWYFPETSLVGETPEGTIVCALNLTPAPLWWGQDRVPGSAIGDVATDPDHQGKGYAGALMRAAVHYLRDNGWWVCPLWPFSVKYYAKFGWAPTTPDIGLKPWPDLIRQLDVDASTVRTATPDDAEGIMAVHTRCAQQTNCQTDRPVAWWHEQLTKHSAVVDVDAKGCVVGFGLFGTKKKSHAQGRTMTVHRLNGVDLPATLRVLRALAEVPDVTVVDLLLPSDSLLPYALPDRAPMTAHQSLQIRVIDPAGALACLHPSGHVVGKISFEVDDWVMGPEQPVGVTAEIADGQVATNAGAGPKALRCDINTFTQLFTGALSTKEARSLGRLDGGDAATDALCDTLLHGRVPHRGRFEPG